MRVRVLGLKDDDCVFEYFSEIEGGYAKYRCSASTSDSLVIVEVVTKRDKGDYGTRSWPRESFNVKNCEPVDSGNLWLDAGRSRIWISKHINDHSNIHYIDESLGSGTAPKAGSMVKIRYRVYGGWTQTAPDSSQQTRVSAFTFGSNALGEGLETAVGGMRVGGQRTAVMRNETVEGVELGGAGDSTEVTFWIELLSVE